MRLPNQGRCNHPTKHALSKLQYACNGERKAKDKAGAGELSDRSAAGNSSVENSRRKKSSAPVVSRPQIPAVSGLPKHKKGLLPWARVSERMAEARVYWIATVDPACRPHATPVDGLWLDERLYFGRSPETRRNRNLAKNPEVSVHLESGSEVVILYGEARELGDEDRELAQPLSNASPGERSSKTPRGGSSSPGIRRWCRSH
jgi:nitroimidazol reductase NimA-like FMN-containing flavoprotein (pyridoxamine 5'-phosphate oxidase superfamily)